MDLVTVDIHDPWLQLVIGLLNVSTDFSNDLFKVCGPVLSRTECEYCGHHLGRTVDANMESTRTSLCGTGELSCQIALQMMTRSWKHAVHEIQQAASDSGGNSKVQVISYRICIRVYNFCGKL
jgi:hypothetical protein